MASSDSPGFLLRKTSLTIRLRFTPAMACSTRTRTRESARLARFCCSVSAPPGGFFFRLAGLADRWLVPLKPRVLVQGGARRVGQTLLVGDPLVIHRPSPRGTEEQHPPAGGVGHEHVLVGVRLLLAAVVPGLFFRAFWPLPAPLRAVDDQRPRARGPLPQLRALSLRQGAEVVQGRAQQGQELVQPVIRARGADAEQLAEHRLQGIGLEVDQDEQQLVRRGRYATAPPASRPALPGPTRGGAFGGVSAVKGGLEGRQQVAELREGQAGQRPEGGRLPHQRLVRHHAAILLFRKKSMIAEGSSEALVGLAVAKSYTNPNDYSEPLRLLDKVIERDPHNGI